jgi:phage terminase large subunit-like protein
MGVPTQVRDWLLLERERRRRKNRAEEAPRYDWYGPPCGCPEQRPDGGCYTHPRARPNQRPPADPDWLVWFILAGRGYGKTRSLVEWIRDRVENGPKDGRYALIGRTSRDVREVMVTGQSGLLSICPPWSYPTYNKTHGILRWPNGAQAFCYSADEPDQLRGPQFHGAACDELAHWAYPEECWSNLRFGLRLGKSEGHVPRVAVATTPLPIPLVKRLVADEKTTRTVTGSTYENKANLAESYIDDMQRQWEGTRLGEQELHAKVLGDTPGALWKADLIESLRVAEAPELIRVVVAVDPSGNNPSLSHYDEDKVAEAGIVVAGIGRDGHKYVMEDISMHGTPGQWGQRAVDAYHEFMADTLAAEVNFGGAMVEYVISSIDTSVAFHELRASRGKTPRAEPIATQYEKRTCHHVGPAAKFVKLESQMCSYVPGMKSPDRMDALVWALTALEEGAPAFFGRNPLEDFRGY